MKTTIPHTIEDRYIMEMETTTLMAEEIAELEKILDYYEEMRRRDKMEMRYQQWQDAKVCGPTIEVCPYCGEELWYELGFWSYYEYLMWTQYYYPKWYGWDMGLSHYRRP